MYAYLLGEGADPTDSIETLARRKRKEIECVSMGEGQDVVALRAINTATSMGSWVSALLHSYCTYVYIIAFCFLLKIIQYKIRTFIQFVSWLYLFPVQKVFCFNLLFALGYFCCFSFEDLAVCLEGFQSSSQAQHSTARNTLGMRGPEIGWNFFSFHVIYVA